MRRECLRQGNHNHAREVAHRELRVADPGPTTAVRASRAPRFPFDTVRGGYQARPCPGIADLTACSFRRFHPSIENDAHLPGPGSRGVLTASPSCGRPHVAQRSCAAAVCRRAGRSGRVFEDRAPHRRGLGEPDGLRDVRFEDVEAIAFVDVGEHFARDASGHRPSWRRRPVPAGPAACRPARVADRLEELTHAPMARRLALQRDEDLVGGGETVDGRDSRATRTVNKHDDEAVADGVERVRACSVRCG